MIPFFDYRPGLSRMRAEIDAAVARVLDSGRLILGPEVEAFEREFSAAVGSTGAVGVNSGTDALALALRALGVGAGDEVLTVANAGVPPVAAIRAAGATPRFVDVDPATLVLDPAGLEAALTPRTRCVLPVHLYGRPAPLPAILDFAARHGLSVVEDCAQAHGTRLDGRHAGTFGGIGCFSFYPTKNLGAFGDAGMCVSDDAGLLERLRMLRTYGFRSDDDRTARVEGSNSRLDELQAAILRVRLSRLGEALAERRAIAARYVAGLAATSLALPPTLPGEEHAWHLFVVRSPRRREVVAALDACSIGHGVHYPAPVHRMEAYAFLGVREGALPHSEAACRSVLSLPCYPGLADDDVDRVIGALRGVD